MPVFGVLDVRFDKVPNKNDKAELVEALSSQVILNDKNYGRAGMLNAVAAFEWIRDSLGDKDMGTESGRVFVALFLRYSEKDFLFRNPGIYDFRFFGDVQLRVIVDEPSAIELHQLERIHELGIPLALFVIEPQNQNPHVALDAVKEIAELGPATDYGKLLRRCLAINKLSSSSYWTERIKEVGIDAMREERLRFVQEHFGDAASRPIASLIDATAVYLLGRELMDAAENGITLEAKDSVQLKEHGVTLLRRAADSPLSLRHQAQIRQRLRDVDAP